MKLAIVAVFVLAAGCLSGPNRAGGDGGGSGSDGGPQDSGTGNDGGGGGDLSSLSAVLELGQLRVWNEHFVVHVASAGGADGYAITSLQLPQIGSDELILQRGVVPAGHPAEREVFGGVLLFDQTASHLSGDASISLLRDQGTTVHAEVSWTAAPLTGATAYLTFYPDGRIVRTEYLDAEVAQGQWLVAYIALDGQRFVNVAGTDGATLVRSDVMPPAPNGWIEYDDPAWVCATTPGSYRVGWASRFIDGTTQADSGIRATFNIDASGNALSAALQTDWVQNRPMSSPSSYPGRGAEIMMQAGLGTDALCSGFAPHAFAFHHPPVVTMIQGNFVSYDSERAYFTLDAAGGNTVEFVLNESSSGMVQVPSVLLEVRGVPDGTHSLQAGARTLVEGADFMVDIDNGTVWLFIGTPVAIGETLVFTSTP